MVGAELFTDTVWSL